MKVETDAVLVGCCAGCNHSHEAPEWQSVFGWQKCRSQRRLAIRLCQE